MLKSLAPKHKFYFFSTSVTFVTFKVEFNLVAVDQKADYSLETAVTVYLRDAFVILVASRNLRPHRSTGLVKYKCKMKEDFISMCG